MRNGNKPQGIQDRALYGKVLNRLGSFLDNSDLCREQVLLQGIGNI